MSREFSPDRQLREAEAIELLQDILEILAVVEWQNVIHQDIKPQNLMRVKLTLKASK